MMQFKNIDLEFFGNCFGVPQLSWCLLLLMENKDKQAFLNNSWVASWATPTFQMC